ncbi:chromosome partitioning protein ParA [Halobaculum rubrum]|uniref:nucleotide-binding protein n=1 Tax=Halobaculum rubrum TaxID=2872158 RepID=UPI001CA3BE84|nr:chromosome partitioning protein ParA [Halobaculum rubrum]QZY00610.1 chromosome partitioning protein ParA [Halobaculum rubrum]
MIVAVAGGKGGVGKSTLAYNVADALDALVVDADLAMADLPGGRERGPDLHDVLAGRATPAEAVRPGPVDVLPCGRTLAGARLADVRRLPDAVAVDGYEHVVVDSPAGLRVDAGAPLAVADACLLVASPTRWALANAVAARELARELDCGLAAVALNRVVDDPPAEAVERALGAPTTAVPADPRLGQSIVAREPVGRTAPGSAAARAVEELAGAVRRCAVG